MSETPAGPSGRRPTGPCDRAQSVRKQGVPAKLVVYQDEHRDIGDPERAIHRLETLLE